MHACTHHQQGLPCGDADCVQSECVTQCGNAESLAMLAYIHTHADWVRPSHAETQTNAIHTCTDTSRWRAVTHMLSSSDPCLSCLNGSALCATWRPNTCTQTRTLAHRRNTVLHHRGEEHPQVTVHTCSPSSACTYTHTLTHTATLQRDTCRQLRHTHTHTVSTTHRPATSVITITYSGKHLSSHSCTHQHCAKVGAQHSLHLSPA